MEDIAVEVVDGSKKLIYCVSLGIVTLAAILIVKVAFWLWYILTKYLPSAPRTSSRQVGSDEDPHVRRYGGRLLGGMQDPEVSAWHVVDVYGTLQSGRGEFETSVVDINRVKVGSRFSFIYARGARMGQRREVVLLEKELRDTGYLMKCREVSAEGRPFIRKYWPNLAFEPTYLEDPPCRSSGSCPPDAGGDTGGGVLFWDPATPHVEGEESTEFLTPTGVEGSDRITAVSYTHLTLPTICSV